MTVGTTHDFTLSRDELIKSAYRAINVIDDDGDLTANQLNNGVQLLNLIIRELDEHGKHLWAISQSPSTINLSAQVWAYTTSNGLQNNIVDLVTAYYRDSSGNDNPLDILSIEGYEAIPNKIESGTPEKIYLTPNIATASKTMYVWPAPLTVQTQSEVVGTDSNNYRCIKSHTADTNNKPITGANHLLFWEQGGSSGVAWVSGTVNYNPTLIRYAYKRPLFDFDNSTDNPDIPQAWFRRLKYLLAHDLSDEVETDIQTRILMKKKADDAYVNIHGSVVPNTNTSHNKALFF